MAVPTPQPPALKLVSGRSPGRDSGGRKVPDAPNFVRLPPNPPSWLSREAGAEWRRIVPELARLGLLKRADRATLTAYCECWARYVTAVRLTHGETKDPETGEARSNLLAVNSQGVTRAPAVMIAEAAAKELRGWAAEFGLTPSAEGRVAALGNDAPPDANPFA